MKTDFHIHSCLSPCASLEMSPLAIVKKAKELGLDQIAITDHNTSRNLPAFEEACILNNMQRKYGVEVTTKEEIHALLIFKNLDKAIFYGEIIEKTLPSIKQDHELYLEQPIIKENEEIKGFCPKLLFAASTYSINELKKLIKEDGLFIPAHINRPVFSISSQLGFLPLITYDGLEIDPRYKIDFKLPENVKTFSKNSDAHYLKDIGKYY